MKVPKRKEYSPEFEAFWKVWQPHMRKTDGKGDANDAFEAYVNAGYTVEDIIDGAKCQIRLLLESGEIKFIQLVKTWLNRRGFEELAVRERAYQARQAERAVEASKPASIAKPKLPDNHFTKLWERGEVQGSA